MKNLGFQRCYSDSGVFVHRAKNNDIAIAVIYIDDSMMTGNNTSLTREMKAKIMAIWQSHDLGTAKEFLGMRITSNDRQVRLDQMAYLKKIVKRFNLEKSRAVSIPLPARYLPVPNTGPLDPKRRNYFQQIIGSLLYLALGTRPDIAFAVIKLSQQAANPSDKHVEDALRIVRYLSSTQEYYLEYNGASNSGLLAYCDSDWASDSSNQRKSHTGYFFTLAKGAVSWLSRAQKTIAFSSTEAEYMALSDCSRQACWFMNLFDELKMPDPTPVPINGDNQGSLFNGQNPVTEGRTKHIDIRFHAIRNYVEEGKVQLFFVPSKENPADMLTKNLSEDEVKGFSSHYGLIFESPS